MRCGCGFQRSVGPGLVPRCVLRGLSSNASSPRFICQPGIRSSVSKRPGNHPGHLPQRQLEQNRDRQTELDRWIREHSRATGLAVRRRKPSHILVQPNQQRAALAQRSSTAGPVRSAIAGGERFAHAADLTAWIHIADPQRSELYNNAPLQYRKSFQELSDKVSVGIYAAGPI
jgi:hypothetical protein